MTAHVHEVRVTAPTYDTTGGHGYHVEIDWTRRYLCEGESHVRAHTAKGWITRLADGGGLIATLDCNPWADVWPDGCVNVPHWAAANGPRVLAACTGLTVEEVP